MAINDAAGMAATSSLGRMVQRRGGGSQPCTTTQTSARPQPASTMRSADATLSRSGRTSSESSAAPPLPVGDPATSGPGAGIAVFVLGEHELVRQGLVDLVSAAPDMLVIGAAPAAAAEGLPGVTGGAPVVVLMDTQGPYGDEIEHLRHVRACHPQVRCILLTPFDDDQALFTALMGGAAGYLVKQLGGDRLLDGIRTVAGGRALFNAAVTERLLNRLRRAEIDERELQLLEMVSRGSTDAQIAEELNRAEDEVRRDLAALCGKLALGRR